MFSIAVDTTLGDQLLRELIADLDTERDKHRRVSPGFLSSATGRGFAQQGMELDSVFRALHYRSLELMDRTAAVADAARRELETVARADEGHAANLFGMEGKL